AARVALRRRAAQLRGRLDARDVDENVDRGVDRESYDVRHASRSEPRNVSCLCGKLGDIPDGRAAEGMLCPETRALRRRKRTTRPRQSPFLQRDQSPFFIARSYSSQIER